MTREGPATRTHHEPVPTTTAASNCSRGGWGANGWGHHQRRVQRHEHEGNGQGHQGTRHRANDGYDDMDTKGMKGGMNWRGNEQMTTVAPARRRKWGGEEHKGVFLFLSFS
jgi:hypothetical protein